MKETFYNEIFQALSWTLLHSVWQGMILTLAAGAVLVGTRKTSAALRYNLLCALFFCFLIGVSLTFFLEYAGNTPYSISRLVLSGMSADNAGARSSLWIQSYLGLRHFINGHSSPIILGWLLILTWKFARMSMALVYLYRLRHRRILPPPHQWQAKFRRLLDLAHITKDVCFMESSLIHVPAVIGYFKPVVLIPAGMLMRLPAAEVEAVLLHELAHIRRHDYLVNLVQRVAEVIFFFNPGLLWISSLLRRERENCCDDAAIMATNNKSGYLAAIISFKEHAMQKKGYGLGLIGKRNELFERMSRIVYNRNSVLSRRGLAFWAANLVVLVVFMIAWRGPAEGGDGSVLADGKQTIITTALQVHNSGDTASWPGPVTAKIKKATIRETHPRENKRLQTASLQPGAREIAAGFQRDNNRQPPNKDQANRSAGLDITNTEHNPREAGQYWVDAGNYQLHADNDRLHFEMDRLQAESDRRQAETDRDWADKDRRQAEIDRQQADKDRQQAQKDRRQADKDRQQAEKNLRQAERDRREAEKNRRVAEKDRQQAEEDRRHSEIAEERSQIELRDSKQDKEAHERKMAQQHTEAPGRKPSAVYYR